jgi:hypothetical protein
MLSPFTRLYGAAFKVLRLIWQTLDEMTVPEVPSHSTVSSVKVSEPCS